MEIQGKLKKIGDIENIPTKSGNTFQKRNIILDCSRMDEWTGDVYTNILSFEVPQARVAEYDQYKVYEGSVVKIRFALNGREVVNGMGEAKYYITARCLELFPQQVQVQQTPQTSVPQAQQPVQPANPTPQPTSETDLPF